MEAVFLGGSRRITRLSENIKSKLDELLDRGLWVYVGDANGADRALQQHMANRGYERVVVYAVTGKLRNNVGRWTVRNVDTPNGVHGFDLYSAKDKQMAKDASYGLMVWDGKSRGTLENVKNLLSYGKPVAVHFGPSRRFVSLRSNEDFRKLRQAVERESFSQQDLPFASKEAAAHRAAAAAGGPRRTNSRRSRQRGSETPIGSR